jgi:hypothetical protein
VQRRLLVAAKRYQIAGSPNHGRAAKRLSRADSIDVGLGSDEHLDDDVEATHGGVVQRRALLPAKHMHFSRQHWPNKAAASLVASLQVGAGVQQNSDHGLVPVATRSVERGLFEAAIA